MSAYYYENNFYFADPPKRSQESTSMLRTIHVETALIVFISSLNCNQSLSLKDFISLISYCLECQFNFLLFRIYNESFQLSGMP